MQAQTRSTLPRFNSCALLLLATAVIGSSLQACAASGSGRVSPGGRQSSAHASTAPQGYLGIDLRDVTVDRLTPLKLKSTAGAEIIRVDHDGPAGKAGLRVQDVVLSMNGQTIANEAQLRRLLREISVGGNVTLVLSREGEPQTVHTQLADRAVVERQAWLQHMTVPAPGVVSAPSASISSALPGSSSLSGSAAVSGAGPGSSTEDTQPAARSHGSGFLSSGAAPAITAPADPHPHSLIGSLMLSSSYTGAVLEMVGPQLAQYFGSNAASGLLVRSVDPNSPAAIAGLRAGDLVLRANSIAVSTPGVWSHLIRESRGRELAVVVLREHQEQTLRLIPDGKRRSSNNNPGPVDGLGLHNDRVLFDPLNS